MLCTKFATKSLANPVGIFDFDDCVNCLHHGSFLSTELTQGECMWINTEHVSVDFVDAEQRYRIPFEHLLSVKWMHAIWWMVFKWMPVAANKTHTQFTYTSCWMEWSHRMDTMILVVRYVWYNTRSELGWRRTVCNAKLVARMRNGVYPQQMSMFYAYHSDGHKS